jgi:uncharacterized protein Yka (UPF0111/DUF47 family)
MSEIIRFFIPKNKLFFSSFDKQSDNLHSMILLFRKAVKEKNTDLRNQYIDRISILNQENFKLAQGLLSELSKNLITPFDREDIHNLTTSLRTISSRLDSLARLVLVSTRGNDSVHELNAFLQHTFEHIEYMGKGVHQLSDLKRRKVIIEACVGIQETHKENLTHYDTALTHSFEDVQDINTLLRNLDIYAAFNDLSKRCKGVAFTLEGILIKYG